MAKKKEIVTITYIGPAVYTYDSGEGLLRYGDSVTVQTPLAEHWQVLLQTGEAIIS
ncbi:MAG: hypothetical protein JW990_09715 [Thermoleophilia bacterium]|nr:hypothetical protein [Thermoleophilia bacterium]